MTEIASTSDEPQSIRESIQLAHGIINRHVTITPPTNDRTAIGADVPTAKTRADTAGIADTMTIGATVYLVNYCYPI